MDPTSFYEKRRGSKDNEHDADENGADGPDSEDYANLSPPETCSGSSPSYAPSDSEISCDDNSPDNEGSHDDASSAHDDNPSNEWNQTVVATRSLSFPGNEHLIVQSVRTL